MYKNRFKGFTLIELLVVIAIIGILSAVVLASLNSARSKGSAAAVKSNLSSIRTQAEIYYDNNTNRYATAAASGANCGTTFTAGTLFADPTISAALAAAYAANGGSSAFYCNVNAAGTGYAIALQIVPASVYWCIDSTGVARDKNASGAAYTGTNGSGATMALDDGSDLTCK